MSKKYINNQEKDILILYGVFYSQYSDRHVSVSIPAIFRVILLLQEYN